MTADTTALFTTFGIGVILTLVAGFYCVMTTRSLIRALIGLEILTKAVTLLIILTGYVTGRMSLAQSLAVTLIIIEVAVIVAAVGIVLCLFRHDNDMDATMLRNLKG